MQWKQQADQVFGIKVHKGKENCYSNAEMDTTLNATQMTEVLFMFIKGASNQIVPGGSTGSWGGKSEIYDKLVSLMQLRSMGLTTKGTKALCSLVVK